MDSQQDNNARTFSSIISKILFFSHILGKYPAPQTRKMAPLWREVAITLFIQSGTAPRGEIEIDRHKNTSIAECPGIFN